MEKLVFMAVWSEINLTDINQYSRIDGDFYQPEYLEYRKKLNGHKNLSHFISEIIHPGEFKRIYSESGVAVLRAQNIRPMRIEADSNSVFIPRSIADNLLRNKLKNGDILITRTGANFGQTALYIEENSEAIVTSHTFILKTNENINSAYLALYLNTKYGRKLLDQGMYGSSQPEIAPKFIKIIPVPVFSKEIENKISEDVILAYKLRKQSQTLYQQATTLLETELGLDKISFEKPKSYTASFSEVLDFSRIDGEHFQPKFRKIREVIENYKNGFERLSANIKVVKPDYQLKNHSTNAIQYIELSNINPSMGYIDRIEEMDIKNAPSRAKRIVFAGDVIASSVVGSVDKAGLVSENENGHIASNGFFQFRSDYYSPEFLLLLIKSNFVKEQFHQQSTGGILSAVPDQNLKYIIIPKIDIELQNQITELVKESHIKVRESKILLEEAKNRVEELIEAAANNG